MKIDDFPALSKKDFRVDWFSGTGPGGQNKNKVHTTCRITHIESGLTGIGQRNRSRVANQKDAFNALVSKLMVYYGADQQKDRVSTDNVVRTYHFERGVVGDGVSQQPVDKTLNGDIDEFLTNGLMGVRPTKRTGRM